MKHSLLFSCSLGLAIAGAAFGQGHAGGPASGPPSGGGGGAPSRPSGPGPVIGTPQNSNPFPTAPAPIYLSGKVLLEDGTPPPDSVVLQLFCGGNPRPLGYTDSKGRFNVDLTDRKNTAMYADASTDDVGGFNGFGGGGGGAFSQQSPGNNSSAQGSGALERMLASCDLQASLAGFRSDQLNLAGRRSMDNPEVGTIILHRLTNVQGLTVSATSALAPKGARKAYEKGLNDAKKAKWANAQREFEKSVAEYPKYAQAWFQLGMARQQQKNAAGAREAYAKALAADSKFVSPYEQLAVLAAGENHWQEAADDTGRLLSLNPVDFPQAWFLNALSNYRLNNLEVAEKAAQSGLNADSAHRLPKMDQLLGVILAARQNYPQAAEHMRAYLRLAPNADDAAEVKKEIAALEKNSPPPAASAP